ncbi:thioredoxin domain-containing protein [Leptolyngbya sp. 'hensonii']|uniref:thioredoxin domain-containing protein n=1 Tax=Leptolyngbya sp. 'hensonii' TaxID=1922337 RepID=UPI00094FF7E7|nr:thioredoxin domain-containing protein [Leptolyngbya sp. 'hensonii']OLP17548.1 thioredoxin domain-containing protein [Leptolyngbya sp. 'hensonii']
MPNRLAQSQSLYLRKHAENPIDWWPWCDEALETAKRENKPIFLSIGYSSCHWCTVMEGEAFSDLTIAEYMNTYFLPIKVDREERPDLDTIYMQALQMMVGQGGWPLNVFLSPEDRVPFYGGTYFPVEPRYGRPGFLRVLQELRRYYDTDKEELLGIREKILGALQSSVLIQPGQVLNADQFRQGVEKTVGVLSPRGSGPSFPMIPYADLTLRAARFQMQSPDNARQLATQRGILLALGGIYDHVGGGFHRYTVDPNWTVPHFEKMLYDNGQIMEYLANLWTTGVQEPAFETAIAGTLQWLQREMTAPAGYFYAAQDADSFHTAHDIEPEEGAFYVWTYPELEAQLTADEFAELIENFTVTPEGNFEGKSVLQRYEIGVLSVNLKSALDKLFQIRYGENRQTLTTFPPARNNQEAKSHDWPGRIPPVTDTKMIVAWNSLMISGLARAATAFQASDYLQPAIQAANFIRQHQWQDGRFHRLNYEGQIAVLAQSEDYALFIKALLDLQQASLVVVGAAPEPMTNWLEQAMRVQEEFDEFLWSVELGGYYNTAADAGRDLIVRERSYVDNATPAANGVAIANLVRLALLSENLDYLDRAEQALQSFGSILQRTPQACPSLFTALDWFYNQTLVRVPADQLNALASRYLPATVLATTEDLPVGAVGLVCQGLLCREPAQTWKQLHQQLVESQVRTGG